MWDCKTSKMSQSPLAALNAFGLFARGYQCRRQEDTTSVGMRSLRSAEAEVY